nr:translation initiation factor IF-2-like isoform X1 [Saimiri boliviensis boliviensis]
MSARRLIASWRHLTPARPNLQPGPPRATRMGDLKAGGSGREGGGRDARHSRRVIQRHRSVPQPHNADGAHNTTHGSTWMCRHTRTQKAEEPARRDPRPHGRYATTPPRAPCTLPQTPAPARSGAQGPPRAPRGAHDPDASRPDTGTPSAATAAAPGPGARLTETRGFLPAGEPAACAV